MLETLPTASGARVSKGWGRRWVRKMQALGCLDRSTRRQVNAAAGQVLDHTVADGRLTARVHGSRWPPYEVCIEIEPLDEMQWRRALEALAERPLYVAHLLAGEVPTELEGVFAEVGCSLLPRDLASVRSSCTCEAGEGGCSHVAAAHHVLADAIEADPFVLLALRGRSRRHLLGALRGSSTEEGMEAEDRRSTVPLPADGDRFWRPADSLHGFEVDRDASSLPPACLVRLGAPGPWAGSEDLLTALAPLYEVMGTQAARLMG